MKTYHLTIFNQSRVITSLFLFPIILLSSLFTGMELMSKNYFWIITIPMFVGLSMLIYYFAKGNLIVEFNNETLIFKWKKKFIFNYSNLDPLPIKEINTLVIDQSQFLRKIITNKREIKISNGKLLMKDSPKFIELLHSIIKQNKGRIIDSWDVWQEAGYLKWALRINTAIITAVFILIVTFGIIKGLKKIPPLNFFMLIFLLPQMFLYQRQMKEKQKSNM